MTTYKTYIKYLFVSSLFLIYHSAWANHSLKISPLPGAVLPTAILNNQKAMAYYLVSNNTNTTLTNNYVKNLPPHVMQITNNSALHPTCDKYFNLNAHMNCILQLQIVGEVNASDTNPTHHLTVCHTDSDCVNVDKQNELNVTVGKANLLAHNAIVFENVNGPMVYSTTDGGLSWEPHPISGPHGFIRSATCSSTGQHCTAIGDYYNTGYITTFLSYTSNDGGINWLPHLIKQFGSASGLLSVSCNGNFGKYCTAVGGFSKLDQDKSSPSQGPIVYTSTDGGVNWVEHILEKKNKNMSVLRAVSCSGNQGQFCTAVGDSYSGYTNKHNITDFIAYKSIDGGNTWTLHPIGSFYDSSSLTGITCDKLNCIAVGHVNHQNNSSEQQAISFKTTDGGETWIESRLPSKKISTFNAISYNHFQYIAVGQSDSGSIFLSQNGMDWKPYYNYSDNTLFSLTCSGQEGQYCTSIGYSNKSPHVPIIYRSIDGGKSWMRRENIGFSNWNDNTKKEIQSVGINIVSPGSM